MTITNNSPTTASYSLPTAKPGDTASRCMTVTYNGSLSANVHFYRSALSGATGLESDTDLVITKGTGTASDCSDFAAAGTGSAIYSGTLNAMATTYAGGYSVLNRAGSATWTNVGPNNVVTFKIQATLNASTPNADQGKTTGTQAGCGDFSPAGAGSAIYSGTLSAMATSYATGYSVLNRAGSATWTNASPNNVVTFKIQATLNASTPSADQGKTTGTHSFTWEAQNT